VLPAQHRHQVITHNLHHVLIGVQAPLHLVAEELLVDVVDEQLDHLEVDIGFEQ
jgi:hypothetical protein